MSPCSESVTGCILARKKDYNNAKGVIASCSKGRTMWNQKKDVYDDKGMPQIMQFPEMTKRIKYIYLVSVCDDVLWEY